MWAMVDLVQSPDEVDSLTLDINMAFDIQGTKGMPIPLSHIVFVWESMELAFVHYFNLFV